jgi:hypothetical protein
MKNYKFLAFFIPLLLAGSLSAQDDLYYDPAKDRVIVDDYRSNKQYNKSTNTNDAYTSRANEDNYDDEEYAYEEDYDYYYSSRIRRFQRPYYGFSFYDPVYVDMSYYDPFLSPYATMLIYDNAFAFGGYGMNRWNRWNNMGFNSWGGMGFGYGGFNSMAWDPWYRWNSFGPSYYGFNNFNSFGFGGGYYCPPTWGNNYGYNTPRDIATNSYYGPRTAGSSRVPQAGDREIRREGPKDVTNTPRQGLPGTPQDRTPADDTVTPRDSDRNTTMPSTRTRAQEERRRATDGGMTTPRTRTQSDQPRTRTSEQPRQTPPERQRSWDNSSNTRSSSPRMDTGSSRSNDSGTRSSSGSSSGPRSSSGSSRRGGN